MSFFRTAKTSITDQETLCKALKQLGYNPQINKEKTTVRGHGTEKNKAEIILRKEDIKDGGDIGFALQKDGTYSIVGDEYVLRNKDHKLTTLSNKITIEYATAKAKKIANQANYEFLGSKKITTKDGKTIQRLQFRPM